MSGAIQMAHMPALLQHVVNPITPIHSPHHSLSSTSSRTPVHTVTLHAYRKQQSTPPGSVKSGKSLKRRAAASDLNTLERVPSTTSTRSFYGHSFSSPRQPSRLHCVQAQPSSPRRLQRALSPSLPVASYDWPPEPSSSVPPDPGGAQAEYPSTDEAENFYRSDARFRDFSKNCKPIKRLPKPLTLNAQTAVLSPLRSETSTSNLISSTGFTSSSTFSLSKFPFPQPPQSVPINLLDRENSKPKSSGIEVQKATSRPDTPPAQTVVHYRGASFDLVNPHTSLYLHDIVTPADRDAEIIDYFPSRPSNELLLGPNMVPLGATDMDSASLSEKRARALYDDLLSAHQSITGSNRIVRNSTNPNTESPLQSTPAAANPRSPPLDPSEQEYLHEYAPAPLNISKPVASPSLMKRIAKTFSIRRKDKMRPITGPIGGDDIDLLPMSPPRLSKAFARPLGTETHSAPVIVGEDEPDIEMGRTYQQDPVSASDGDLAYGGYYDLESIYPSSMGLTDNDSIYPSSSIDNRRSVPFGVKTGETNYSSEVDLHSHPWEFGHGRSQRGSRDALQNQFFVHTDAHPSEKKDSTIESILNRYHGRDISEVSISDLIDMEEEDVRRSESSGLFPADGSPSLTSMRQFDFRLNRASSSHNSTISGPRTPQSQQTVFPRMRAPFGMGGLLPPRALLPVEPSIELEEPRPPFAHRFPPQDSDMFSSRFSSSYGDTRNLLLLSQPLNSSGIPRIEETPASPGRDTLRWAPRGNLQGSSSYSQDNSSSDLAYVPAGENHEALVEQLGHELKRLSNHSSLSGQAVAVSDISTSEEEKPKVALTQLQVGQLGDSSEIKSSDIVVEASSSTPPEALAEAERLFDAQPAGTVHRNPTEMPALWRKLSPVLRVPNEKGSPGKDSYADMDDEGDDWETVADPSRANLPREPSTDSVADCSDVYTIRPSVESQRGAQAYEQRQGGPSLLPPYDFRGGVGFPRENVLAPARQPSNPYRRPSPLPESHDHPFRSSPPTISPTTSPIVSIFNRPQESKDQEAQRGAELKAAPFIPYYNLTPQQTMDLLSFGPNDSILYEGADPMPTYTGRTLEPRSATVKNTSDSSHGILDFLREEEPATSSSPPGSDRENSFAKLTLLGPKGNLTGTPKGTNMREVGSSLADSSSPGLPWDSTPSEPKKQGSPLAYFQSSPPAPLDRSNESTPSQPERSRQTSQASTRSQDKFFNAREKVLLSHRRQVTEERLQNAQAEGSRRKRASVRGQTKLREMMLTTPDSATIKSAETNFTHFLGSERPESFDTHSPLRTRPIPARPMASEHSPHILAYPRPDSSVYSVLRNRKNRYSWILFTMLAWFPPFLVLYGVGKMDWLMVYLSHGQFDRCGKHQKKAALWSGITLCTVPPVIVVIVLLLSHFEVL